MSDDASANVPLHSEMRPNDWDDIANSEFVDYVESELLEDGKIGFVFEHEEIGLHGFKFDPSAGVLMPCLFNKRGVADDD